MSGHPLWARLFARQAEQAEGKGVGERRAQLLEGISGRVLEIGAGTGLNFARYPDSVTEVVALEPEPHLAQLAERAAERADAEIAVVRAAAETMPFPDDAFDAVVSFHVLCSVRSPERVLAQARRVLRPGGELRFNEHVASTDHSVARLQRAADLIWPHVAGGCHLGRDTEAAVAEAGFAIDRLERYRFGIPPLDPPKPHILGRAIAPGCR